MKKIVLITLGLLMMAGLKAQLSYQHYPAGYLFPAATPEKYFYDHQQQEQQDDQPGIHYRLNMGGTFVASPWYKGFSTYVAPEFSFAVTPRFFLSGGVRVEQFFPSGAPSPGPEGGQTAGYRPATSLFFYASGTYLIRPNFSVTGTIMKNLDLNKNISPFARNYNYYAPDSYSLRFDYQLSRNIHLGAEFRYMNYNNYNPYYPGASMFGPPSYNPFSPYGW
jgi:hypothetical protein